MLEAAGSWGSTSSRLWSQLQLRMMLYIRALPRLLLIGGQHKLEKKLKTKLTVSRASPNSLNQGPMRKIIWERSRA